MMLFGNRASSTGGKINRRSPTPDCPSFENLERKVCENIIYFYFIFRKKSP
jgi:hypothetical protein